MALEPMREDRKGVGVLDGMQSFGLAVLLFGLPFSEAMKSIGLAIAVVGFLGKLALGARPRLGPRGTLLALLAFYAACALSVAAAEPELRRPHELFTLAMTIVPFILVADACARPSRKLFFALTIVAGATLAALLAYVDHMTGSYQRTVLGSVENAIPAAEYLGAVVPLAVALLLEEMGAPLAGPLLGLAVGSLGIVFIMTKSRGPLPAAITGFAMAIGMSLRRWRHGLIAAAACCSAFLIFVVANPGSRAASAMTPGRRDSESRLVTWRMTADLIAERPLLGHGLGSYPDLDVVYVDERVTIHQLNAHSAWLQVTCDSGALGAGSLVVFLVLALGGPVRTSRRSRGLDRAVSVGALGGVVSILLAGLFSVSTDAEPGILLFTLAALGSASGVAGRPERGRAEP
ncbi:MAG: O-antigen ligase family protein [Candidatus Eisenbacteria bacterium]